MNNKTEEIKTEYYENAIRGDFQNETDIVDIDSIWNYFESKLQEFSAQQNKELEAEVSIQKKKVELNYNEIVRLESELSQQKELVEEKEYEIKQLRESLEFMQLNVVTVSKRSRDRRKQIYEANQSLTILKQEIEGLKKERDGLQESLLDVAKKYYARIKELEEALNVARILNDDLLSRP